MTCIGNPPTYAHIMQLALLKMIHHAHLTITSIPPPTHTYSLIYTHTLTDTYTASDTHIADMKSQINRDDYLGMI